MADKDADKDGDYLVVVKNGYRVKTPAGMDLSSSQGGGGGGGQEEQQCGAAPPAQTSSEEPTVEAAFGEMIETNPRERENSLLVVLDAANIGWAYGRDERFDVTGVENAIQFFAQAHHHVAVTALQ